MLYDYLLKNFRQGEPIFFNEIPSKSKSYARNVATTKQRTLNIDNRKVTICKPYIEINKDNVKILEFLELMCIIYRYAELSDDEIKIKLKLYIAKYRIDFKKVKKYIEYFPNIIYKNLYKAGLINELV